MESKKTDLVSIGKRISTLRGYQKLTQQELAEKLGITRVKMNALENGRQDFKTGEMAALADALNTTTDYILRGVESENIDISRETGLNEQSITLLRHMTFRNQGSPDHKLEALNFLLGLDEFESFLQLLADYMVEIDQHNKYCKDIVALVDIDTWIKLQQEYTSATLNGDNKTISQTDKAKAIFLEKHKKEILSLNDRANKHLEKAEYLDYRLSKQLSNLLEIYKNPQEWHSHSK